MAIFLIIVPVTSGYLVIRLAVVQRSNFKLTVVVCTCVHGIYIHIIQFVYCLCVIQAKTTVQGATKLSGIMKYSSGSVLHGLKSTI